MKNRIFFKISGMDCTSCAKVIKYALEEEKGIDLVEVDFKSAKAQVEFDGEATNPSEIKNKIENLGYKATEA